MNDGIDKNEICYPYIINYKNAKISEEEQSITINDGLTVFVGPNGSGKTQTMKTIRDVLKRQLGSHTVRYLTSNRIAGMETYRSKVNQYSYKENEYQVGDQKTKAVRKEIETATGDFFTLDDRKDIYIKVVERLRVLFNRQLYLRWDSGNLKIFFEKTENQNEYPVTGEASGLVNIVSILAALYDDEVKVLLIDEPEVSLHPQYQAYLLREIKEATVKYGKTVILSTHSTYMLPMNVKKDICNIVFFQENCKPIQISADAPELKSAKIEEFIIRMGQNYKSGFFAKKILLIEGITDQLICKYLANRLDLNVDVSGSQIIPVDGKGQFPVVAKFFRMIGKEVSVLTDLDGFVDDNNVIDLFLNLPYAIDLANEKGLESLNDIVKGIRTYLGKLIDSYKSEMLSIYGQHPYWKMKDVENEDKAVRRSIVGMMFTVNDEDFKTWPAGDEWSKLKKRVEALLGILELVGCFILKKGAIESYYCFASNDTFSEKPSAAIEEMAKLNDKDNEFLLKEYKDMISAIEWIANTNTVDESFAVKKELLSEIALVLEVLSDKTTTKDITAAIKQAKNNAGTIFSYEIIKNQSGIMGVKVNVDSSILNVNGFPLEVFKGNNVNEIVTQRISKG